VGQHRNLGPFITSNRNRTEYQELNTFFGSRSLSTLSESNQPITFLVPVKIVFTVLRYNPKKQVCTFDYAKSSLAFLSSRVREIIEECWW
jgi:hypothetical protein